MSKLPEMVRRVALAIQGKCAGCDPADLACFVAAARAAMIEIRVPTEAMLDAAWDTVTYEEIDPELAWPAMIDAALGRRHD